MRFERNYLEAAIVIDGARSPIASRRFDEAVTAAMIFVEQSPGNMTISLAPPIVISEMGAAIRRA